MYLYKLKDNRHAHLIGFIEYSLISYIGANKNGGGNKNERNGNTIENNVQSILRHLIKGMKVIFLLAPHNAEQKY